jgi:two-component system, NarL family, sensor kinase
VAARRTVGAERTPLGRRPPWVRLADGQQSADGARSSASPPTARRVLVRFAIGNLLVAGLLLAGSVWASHVAARSEALADARGRTDLLATVLIEPELDADLLAGDPQAVAQLDTVVEEQLRDASVARIKIWDADQRIVYSDEDQLRGRTFPESEYSVASLLDGHMTAEVSDLVHEENQFERSAGRLLEVYRPVTAESGERLLLEAYFDYDQVTSRQGTIRLQFAAISAAALVLLLLLQLPLVTRMIRDIRAADRERLRLHAQAADATAEERRRIAGGLHDGVVQDLSAAPLIMSRVVDHLESRSPGTRDESVAADLRTATDAVRQSVSSLRSLLIEIYPPHLARAGLPAALGDLAARAQSRGITTHLHLPDDLDLPPESAALLFRVAQEAFQNMVKHARARTAVLTLIEDESSVAMEIRDDGVGFDPATVSTVALDGHFGLRLLSDLAGSAGATLDFATAPGRGTALRLCLHR